MSRPLRITIGPGWTNWFPLFGNELALGVDHRYHHSLLITDMLTRSRLNRAHKLIRANYKVSFIVNALANARNAARIALPRMQ